METIQKTVLINAPAEAVWETLTHPHLINQWMHDSPLEVQSDWKVGNTLIVSGDLHGIPFVNSGHILAFEPGSKLSYTFLSSISNLPDADESHCLLEFKLKQENTQTRLELSISNFPDEVIRKHLELYWAPTLELIRQQAENNRTTGPVFTVAI